MKSWVKFAVRMNVTDDETFGTDEHAHLIREGTVALSPQEPAQDDLTIGKCGGRQRVELSTTYRQLPGGAVEVSGHAKLADDGRDVPPGAGVAKFCGVIPSAQSRHFRVNLRGSDPADTSADIFVEVGVLAWSPDDPSGAIEARAGTLGQHRTGHPTSGCEAVRGGFRRRYEHGDLYFSAASGVALLSGDLRRKYEARGGPDGDLGLPVSGETTNSDGLGKTAHFSRDATLSWHPRTGPMIVQGAIRAHWLALDAELGSLGYPTGDVLRLDTSPPQEFGDFQDGILVVRDNVVMVPPVAGLSGREVTLLVCRAVRSLLIRGGVSGLEPAATISVSDTAYDFSRSGNRVVTYRFTGWLGPDRALARRLDLTLPVQFTPSPHPDGRRAVKLVARQAGVIGVFLSPGAYGSEDTLLRSLRETVGGVFTAPLVMGVVPASAGLLSFKVLRDGGIRLSFRPGAAGRQAAEVAQTTLGTWNVGSPLEQLIPEM